MIGKFSGLISGIRTSFAAEMKRVFSDYGVLIFFFGVQLSYPVIYPIPFYHQQVRDLPVAVVDLDNSMLSRQLIRYIDANENVAVAKRFLTLDAARASFDSGETTGIVHIPHDFERHIMRSEKAYVSLFTDAGYFMIYRQVYQGVLHAAGTVSAGIEVKKLLSKGVPSNLAFSMRDPVPLESVPLYNRTGAYGSYLVPAVLIIILQQTLLIGIGMLGGTARERNSMHYLLSCSGGNCDLVPMILGKTFFYLSLYFVHITYFFGILFKVYSYPQNASILSIYLFMLPFILSVTFLAIALSTVFRSRESSVLFILCTSIPFVLLSGFSWPIESIPSWLRALSLLVPTTSAIEGFLRLDLMGAPFSAILPRWGTLWLLCGIYFVCAVLAYGRVRRIHSKEGMFG
jgi:ABC-2 type transport system permease protein